MQINDTKEYNTAIINRLKIILEICGLEISGFAALLNKSESHIYGIINGSRELSSSFAKEIGNTLEFDYEKIFNLNLSIPESIKSAKILINFRRNNNKNPEYFTYTKKDRSLDYFIKNELIRSDFFDVKRFVKDVRKYCQIKYSKDYTSDELSKGLNYVAEKGLLKVDKMPLLKNNGQTGKRMVDVFWK